MEKLPPLPRKYVYKDRKDEGREYARKRRLDPEFKAREAARMRERRRDPAFKAAERIKKREYNRERYASDPEFREKERTRKNAISAVRWSDPEYRKEKLARGAAARRAKYSSDEGYREQIRNRRREEYQRNREYYLSKSKQSYAERREIVYVAYGGCCCCCGEDNPMFLGIDHVNGDGSAHRKLVHPSLMCRKIIEEGFPDRYRLMCSNCNLGRWRNGGVCPHQVKKGG